MEFHELNEMVQNEGLAHLKVLAKFGLELGRLYVDTLRGSKHANTKELVCNADKGTWKLAFAFDPARKATLTVVESNQVARKRGFITI